MSFRAETFYQISANDVPRGAHSRLDGHRQTDKAAKPPPRLALPHTGNTNELGTN